MCEKEWNCSVLYLYTYLGQWGHIKLVRILGCETDYALPFTHKYASTSIWILLKAICGLMQQRTTEGHVLYSIL